MATKQGPRMVGQSKNEDGADSVQAGQAIAPDTGQTEGTALTPQANTFQQDAEMFGTARVKHLSRAIAAIPSSPEIWSAQQADAEIGAWLRQGFDVRLARPFGFGPHGVNVMWVLERPTSGNAGFSEAKHMVRTLGRVGAEASITGFQADALVTSYLDEGWTLKAVEPMGVDPNGGVSVLWVMVR